MEPKIQTEACAQTGFGRLTEAEHSALRVAWRDELCRQRNSQAAQVGSAEHWLKDLFEREGAAFYKREFHLHTESEYRRVLAFLLERAGREIPQHLARAEFTAVGLQCFSDEGHSEICPLRPEIKRWLKAQESLLRLDPDWLLNRSAAIAGLVNSALQVAFRTYKTITDEGRHPGKMVWEATPLPVPGHELADRFLRACGKSSAGILAQSEGCKEIHSGMPLFLPASSLLCQTSGQTLPEGAAQAIFFLPTHAQASNGQGFQRYEYRPCVRQFLNTKIREECSRGGASPSNNVYTISSAESHQRQLKIQEELRRSLADFIDQHGPAIRTFFPHGYSRQVVSLEARFGVRISIHSRDLLPVELALIEKLLNVTTPILPTLIASVGFTSRLQGPDHPLLKPIPMQMVDVARAQKRPAGPPLIVGTEPLIFRPTELTLFPELVARIDKNPLEIAPQIIFYFASRSAPFLLDGQACALFDRKLELPLQARKILLKEKIDPVQMQDSVIPIRFGLAVVEYHLAQQRGRAMNIEKPVQDLLARLFGQGPQLRDAIDI